MQIGFFTRFTDQNLQRIIFCLKEQLTSGSISFTLFEEQPEHILNPRFFFLTVL